MLQSGNSVGVFIDWENLRFSLQLTPRRSNIPNTIDWEKFKSFFDSPSARVRYHLYGAHSTDREHIELVSRWKQLGFNTMFKRSQVVTARDGQSANRKNADIEIAVDAILSHKAFDHVIIFSGDGDFTYLVEKLKSFGIWVTVISFFEPYGAKNNASRVLLEEADSFVQLRTFLDMLEEHDPVVV